MAKQGEAGRALGAALAASLQGALIGAFALALIIPVVRPIVLAFGSPEFFMMTVLGVTFVASLSGGAMLKGLIAGGVGFLLSMIRLDPQTGVQRATFGFLPLWDGIGLIPVTIGLFAIPELIDLAVRGTGIAGGSGPTRLGGVMRGIGDTFRHGWLMVRCSIIGTVIGIMPGLGGGVAQWIAYAHAVQSSPNRERFGKGAVEGVIGPASANNSKDGGDLIPTVAFGVPGSVSTAILLGAFLIHGLQPGPPMLTDQLPLVFTMVWTLVVANIITVAICLLFLRQLVKITYVRGSYVIPFVLFLVFFGAYADKNQLFDVVLPRPPMILGLVLGALTERYLFLSVNRYEWEWLTRPMVLAFFVCIVAVLVYSIRQELRGRAEARAVRVASDP
jgi:TctA family transporter